MLINPFNKTILLSRIWRPSFCDEVDRVKGRATMIKTPQKEILKETARSYPPSTPTSSGNSRARRRFFWEWWRGLL